jgi:hypothetical protein
MVIVKFCATISWRFILPKGSLIWHEQVSVSCIWNAVCENLFKKSLIIKVNDWEDMKEEDRAIVSLQTSTSSGLGYNPLWWPGNHHYLSYWFYIANQTILVLNYVDKTKLLQCHTFSLLNGILKGQSSEIFLLRFFSSYDFFWSHWTCLEAISNLFEFSWRYSFSKSTPRCQWQRGVKN